MATTVRDILDRARRIHTAHATGDQDTVTTLLAELYSSDGVAGVTAAMRFIDVVNAVTAEAAALEPGSWALRVEPASPR
ncbi:hypothetical protein [Nocardia amamiensis]|uniref:hypothetical protein n=1 Tax=Nocardia amamiensis TaxID=404578 RepID=UPI000832F7AD|nr:hypothetical protein [Nocardia amamiensis]